MFSLGNVKRVALISSNNFFFSFLGTPGVQICVISEVLFAVYS